MTFSKFFAPIIWPLSEWFNGWSMYNSHELLSSGKLKNSNEEVLLGLILERCRKVFHKISASLIVPADGMTHTPESN